MSPGKHRLTVRVDNRMLLNYRPDAHAVSDSLGSTWNGIVGKIELRSTSPVWIEDVQVFPQMVENTLYVNEGRKRYGKTIERIIGSRMPRRNNKSVFCCHRVFADKNFGINRWVTC